VTINKYLAVNPKGQNPEPKGIYALPAAKKIARKSKEERSLPITDPLKRSIAQKKRLYMKVCRECGARNAPTAKKCRKCRSPNIRWKRREKSR